MPFKVINPIKLTIAIGIALLLILSGAVWSGMATQAKYNDDCEMVYKAEVTTYNGHMAVAHYEVPVITGGN